METTIREIVCGTKLTISRECALARSRSKQEHPTQIERQKLGEYFESRIEERVRFANVSLPFQIARISHAHSPIDSVEEIFFRHHVSPLLSREVSPAVHQESSTHTPNSHGIYSLSLDGRISLLSGEYPHCGRNTRRRDIDVNARTKPVWGPVDCGSFQAFPIPIVSQCDCVRSREREKNKIPIALIRSALWHLCDSLSREQRLWILSLVRVATWKTAGYEYHPSTEGSSCILRSNIQRRETSGIPWNCIRSRARR